jgi:hypothetical protein
MVEYLRWIGPVLMLLACAGSGANRDVGLVDGPGVLTLFDSVSAIHRGVLSVVVSRRDRRWVVRAYRGT